MGIHVVQSQRIDALFEAMCQTVRQVNTSALQVLQPQHFIVPSVAVETWLVKQLAEKYGISANTIFHHRIRGFQWALYQDVLQHERQKVRQANIPRLMIKWRVFHALKPFIQHQIQIDTKHPVASLIQRIEQHAQHLQGRAQQEKKQSMLYWIAEQVSRLFSNYMVYRGENHQLGLHHHNINWLECWGNGQLLPIDDLFFSSETSDFTKAQAKDLQLWQAWLWREIFHEDFQLIQTIDQQFWQTLGSPQQPSDAIKAVPKKLVVFTLLELPPAQLQFLRRLGQYTEIYLFHYNPSQEYWADSVDPNWKTRYDVRLKERFLQRNPNATDQQIHQFFESFSLSFDAQNRESRHPLLTRLGKQARDHFSLLSNLSSGEEGVWADLFIDDYENHLLAQIQSDILHLAQPQANQYQLQPDDESIQIHVCHSVQRQLEVLKDQLIYWLSQSADHQPTDILVLCPQLKQIESAIRSVFLPPIAGATDQFYLPVQIAGVTQLDVQKAWQAVLGRIQLLQDRFTLEQLMDWLSLDASLQRYQLNLNDINRMSTLLVEAGFKRGFDAAHLQKTLAPNDQDYRFSFKFALDRLALGIAVPEHALFNDILSIQNVMQSDFELITKLIEIYQDLNTRRDWLDNDQHTVERWLKILNAEIDQFIEAGVDALKTVKKIMIKQERMLTLSNYYHQEHQLKLDQFKLPLAFILDEVQTMLDSQIDQAIPTGYITFSQIGQIRPLPYKLVVVLNLESGKFPNRDSQIPFDLMSLLKPQLGDRSRLDDDQGAFLDALLLAKENFWLFYNGFDANDQEVRDPSSIVQELLQHLEFIVAKDETLAKQTIINGLSIATQLLPLYRVHTLQPFDYKGFDGKVVRYKDQWFKVADQLLHATKPRQSWIDQKLEVIEQNQILDAQQWIKDITFPARLYLKTLGIKNLEIKEAEDDFEPLFLTGLSRYKIREFLRDYSDEINPKILMDCLPVGKTQHVSLQLSISEKDYIQQRLQKYASHETQVTKWLYPMQGIANTYLQITRPKLLDQSHKKWVSVTSSSARANRKAHLWLEYLLWLAHENLADGGTDYQRIMLFSDQTILCTGVSSNQAIQFLKPWFEAWQYAQMQPLVLPAELLLQKTISWDEVERHPMSDKSMEDLLKNWNSDGRFSKMDVSQNEASKYHKDWKLILQEQDATILLRTACKQFSYALYQPIFLYQVSIEE